MAKLFAAAPTRLPIRTHGTGKAATWGLRAVAVCAVSGYAYYLSHRSRPHLNPTAPADETECEPPPELGSVRSEAFPVRSDDGVDLMVEVDEVPRGAGWQPTVVFCHGFTMNMDCWHYQRLAMRGNQRLVFWDQRGHGRSGVGPRSHYSVEQCGRDLLEVLTQVCAGQNVILVGHSMGGMAIMAAAAEDPEYFARHVTAIALISTTSGGLDTHDFGLFMAGRAVHRIAPELLELASRRPELVQRTRTLAGELERAVVRRFAFRSKVDPALVRFVAGMLAETKLEVVGDFFRPLSTHDKRHALATVRDIEVTVMVGAQDNITPMSHSQVIAQALPKAHLVVVPRAGHALPLEHPHVVNAHLRSLVARARRWQENHPRDTTDP